MSKAVTFKLCILVAILSISFAFSLGPVLAHGGEDHEEKAEMTSEQMEQMIQLLQQLVTVLTQYKAQYGTHVAPATYVAPVHHEEEHEVEEEHEEDHAEATTEAKLVIEIEPHNGKTHAHVRYTDKPEEMFFVDSAIEDEHGVVEAISAKTGLSADVVRTALKYIQ